MQTIKKSYNTVKSLGIITLLIFISISLHSQNQTDRINFDITKKFDKELGKGSITLTITQGVPDFKYILYDKAPWDGGKLIAQSESTVNNTYTFRNLSAGKYFVGANDSKKYSKFIVVDLE